MRSSWQRSSPPGVPWFGNGVSPVSSFLSARRGGAHTTLQPVFRQDRAWYVSNPPSPLPASWLVTYILHPPFLLKVRSQRELTFLLVWPFCKQVIRLRSISDVQQLWFPCRSPRPPLVFRIVSLRFPRTDISSPTLPPDQTRVQDPTLTSH